MPQPLPDVVDQDDLKQVVILGAGPAGLTAAYELTRHAIPVTVLEKDPLYVGGIARTVEYRGNRIDIGGHRFFSKSSEIEDLWTEILGDELLVQRRLSHIFFRGRYLNYPLDVADLLANLSTVEMVRCIASYIWAQVHPVKNPQTYEDWVVNEFGRRLFRILFKPYTEKVWGMNTREMSADWAPQRIRRLYAGEAIRCALFSKQKAFPLTRTQINQFRYPRLGPGQMWERIRSLLEAHGQRVMMGQEVIAIQHDGAFITRLIVRNDQGEAQEIRGTHVISTIPIRELVQICDPPLPRNVQEAAGSLKYRDFLTVVVLVNKDEVFPDHWIYLPDPSVKVGRIQNFKNWSPALVADRKKTCLGMEYFCFEGDGLWTMPDEQLVTLAQRELIQSGICQKEEVLDGIVVRQPKAYPVYDETYKERVALVREYMVEHLQNLQMVGRNGMHHYNNQDHSMMTALLAARSIATGAQLDPWMINRDTEYYEEVQPGTGGMNISGRLVPRLIR